MQPLSMRLPSWSASTFLVLLMLIPGRSLIGADFLEDIEEGAPLYPNLRVGLGPTWIHNAELSTFRYERDALFGWDPSDTDSPAAPVSADMSVESDVEFDLGPALTLGLGGKLNMPRWLHVEIETGFTLNRLRFQAEGTELDGDLWQVPGAVNLTVPWRLSNSWELFGGIGGGVMFGVMDLNGQAFAVRDIPDEPNTVVLEGQSLTAAGTYQAFAGVRYRLKASSGLSLSYRFRGTTSPTWNWKANLDGVEGEWEIETDHLLSHAVLLSFDYNW